MGFTPFLIVDKGATKWENPPSIYPIERGPPMPTAKLRPGTKIEVKGFDLKNEPVWYPAKIGAWGRNGSPVGDRWHPITLPDGARLQCHESSFRVVENRP
jgi:hypothetical protein